MTEFYFWQFLYAGSAGQSIKQKGSIFSTIQRKHYMTSVSKNTC